MASKPCWAAAVQSWIVLAVLAGAATVARAELKVTDLTGTAVATVGPYFQDVRDAIAAFAARDFPKALARLQNAKKLTPALAPAEVMMAQLYFDAGDAAGGIGMLEKAIQQGPKDPEAYVFLIERALAEGRLTEAESIYPLTAKILEAFNQNPRRKQNLQMRAFLAGAAIDLARGRLDAAKAKLESAIKLDPRNAVVHEKLGRILFAQNDPKAAYQQFQLVAEADKSAAPAELMMATLSADRANAEKWLNYALKQSPGDVRTQLGAANYYLKNNQVEEAKKYAEEAVKLDPEGHDSNLLAGLIARMEGDFRKADKFLSTAQLRQPANFNTMHHLALVLIELPEESNKARALQYAELMVKDNPNNPNYLGAFGWVNYRLNRKVEAQRAFAAVFNTRDVKSTQFMSAEMGYFLANLAKDLGNTQEAIKLLRESLNTAEPFGYRKLAEQMLAELTKANPKAAGSGDTAKPAVPAGGSGSTTAK